MNSKWQEEIGDWKVLFNFRSHTTFISVYFYFWKGLSIATYFSSPLIVHFQVVWWCAKDAELTEHVDFWHYLIPGTLTPCINLVCFKAISLPKHLSYWWMRSTVVFQVFNPSNTASSAFCVCPHSYKHLSRQGLCIFSPFPSLYMDIITVCLSEHGFCHEPSLDADHTACNQVYSSFIYFFVKFGMLKLNL